MTIRMNCDAHSSKISLQNHEKQSFFMLRTEQNILFEAISYSLIFYAETTYPSPVSLVILSITYDEKDPTSVK